MKKYFYGYIVLFLIFACLLTTGCGGFFEESSQSSKNLGNEKVVLSEVNSTETLVSKCKTAVVGIASVGSNFQSIGSGVCVDKNGYVLTNYHVIEDGRQITLYLSNGQKQSATVVWTDPSSDLAMLKTDANIPYLAISGGGYKSGDEVVAIGTPIDLAFKHTATKGIISATNRTIVVDNNFGQSTLYDLIQHDASINPGNSGGPLVNMNGEVVGINTVKVTDAEGLGFAIPADTFKPVAEKISATGGYQTTYLGVFGYDSQLKDFSNTSGGYYVQSVAKDSPASLNGIEQGDIITKVGKKNITVARDLKTALYDYDIGDVVRVVVVRNGVEKFFDVELTSRPWSWDRFFQSQEIRRVRMTK